MSLKTYSLKVTKATFALAIGLVNATSVLVGFLVNFYIPAPELSGALTVFVASVSSVIVAYLATEEGVAPAP